MKVSLNKSLKRHLLYQKSPTKVLIQASIRDQIVPKPNLTEVVKQLAIYQELIRLAFLLVVVV